MCTACGDTGYIKVGSGISNPPVEPSDLYWTLLPCWCVSWFRLESHQWDYDKPPQPDFPYPCHLS